MQGEGRLAFFAKTNPIFSKGSQQSTAEDARGSAASKGPVVGDPVGAADCLDGVAWSNYFGCFWLTRSQCGTALEG